MYESISAAVKGQYRGPIKGLHDAKMAAKEERAEDVMKKRKIWGSSIAVAISCLCLGAMEGCHAHGEPSGHRVEGENGTDDGRAVGEAVVFKTRKPEESMPKYAMSGFRAKNDIVNGLRRT